METLDIFRLVIPESQKKVYREFYHVRNTHLLKLYEFLNDKGNLPPQLKGKLEDLRKENARHKQGAH